jgi:hypothetical protein
MPEKKKTGRDFPLAPTSIPQAVDNTSVKKRMYGQEQAAPYLKNGKQSVKMATDIQNMIDLDSKYGKNTDAPYYQDQKKYSKMLFKEGYSDLKKADSIRKRYNP